MHCYLKPRLAACARRFVCVNGPMSKGDRRPTAGRAVQNKALSVIIRCHLSASPTIAHHEHSSEYLDDARVPQGHVLVIRRPKDSGVFNAQALVRPYCCCRALGE